jgi:hypothetical protein
MFHKRVWIQCRNIGLKKQFIEMIPVLTGFKAAVDGRKDSGKIVFQILAKLDYPRLSSLP